MGPEDQSNKKKYPSFFLKPNRRKLQNISKNVSLKIGSRLPQKLSLIFKNAHNKISRSKGPKYPYIWLQRAKKTPQRYEFDMKHAYLIFVIFFTRAKFFGSKKVCTGVPHILLHVSYWTCTSGEYFWPSEVIFRGILALSSDWFYNGHIENLG